MVMMTAAAFLMVMVVMLVVMMMVMMVMMVVLQFLQFLLQTVLAFHGLQQLLPGQFVPGCNHQCSFCIVLPQQGNGRIQLGLGNVSGTGKDNGGSSFDLVVVELAKVLHIDLNLTCIGHSDLITEDNIVARNLLHRGYHIAELTHTGRLDDDTVGVILLDDLGQRLAEIAHQRAADAA